MIIKKMLLLVAFVCMLSGAVFAALPERESVSMEKNKTSDIDADCSKQIAKARNYYFNGDLENAERYVNEALNISNDNLKANELRNKILLLKEKIKFFKRDLVNDYLIELRRTVKDGNYYEGFLFLKKIESLAPQEDVNASYTRLSTEQDLIKSTIDNSKDKADFVKSVYYFQNEKFEKAHELIYRLYKKYPKFTDFVGMSRCYIIQETNNKRSLKLYKQAVSSVKKNRYGEARNLAEQAFNLQSDNVKMKMLVEQINMEIM